VALNSEDRFKHLEEKWPVLHARAEKSRWLWPIAVAVYAGVVAALILSWSSAFVRMLLEALIILETPVFFHLLYVILPQGQALHRLTIEEYASRLRNLRESPQPPGIRLLSGVVSAGGLATVGLALVLLVRGPYTIDYLYRTVFLALGSSLLLVSASTFLALPIWEKVDKVMTGGTFAPRLRRVVLGYAGAGLVYLSTWGLFRLGIAVLP
jgi:hypothetical protein